jgi:XTP/dITP diphosphohydrolase
MRRLEAGNRLVVASHNKGKLWEIDQLIHPYGLDAVSAGALGLPEPEETETTFAGNARLKALAAARASGLPALADDSGLEVDALDGAPGIYSARWAGPAKDFSVAMQRVHDELAARDAWSASPKANFISVICLAWPDGHTEEFEGRVDGTLVWPPRGGNGFGYDPMFCPLGAVLTFGEMEPADKYAISHRTRAFDKFRRAALEGRTDDATAAAPTKTGDGLAALEAAAANLSTREELVRFLANLRADHALHAASWTAASLADYLAALERTLMDPALEPEPKWRLLAKTLLAASR